MPSIMEESSTTKSTGIDNRSQLTTAAIVLLCQSWFAISLRLFVRIKLTKSFDLDDWLMALAQIVFTLLCVFFLMSVHYGLGLHNAEVSIENQTLALKYKTLATLHYIASLLLAKLSIAFFLLRIAVRKPFEYAIKASMVIITIWSTAIFFYYIFLCSPVQAQWDKTIENPTCQPGRNFVVAAYSLGGMSIISDWFYALLPVPIILSLQMNLRVKLTLCFVLALGIFGSIAGIIRLASLFHLADEQDPLFSTTQTMIYTLVEPGVAIVAASLVTIRPLLRALRFRGFESEHAPGASYFGNSPQLNTREGFSHLADGSGSSNGMSLSQAKQEIPKPVLARRTSAMDKFKGRGFVYRNEGSEGRYMEIEERMVESRGGAGAERGDGIVRTVDVRVESMRVSEGGMI